MNAKIIALIISLILNALLSFGQSLKERPLTEKDSTDNVRWRYEYHNKDGFYGKSLLLFKNGKYQYASGGCLQSSFSEGRWAITGKVIVLNSDIKRNDVPVSVSYTDDTSDIVKAFKFGVIRNKKGVELSDAFVNINSDSVKCLPWAGGCGGNYNKIDSARLIFENGFTSRWVRIANNDKYVLLKAEIDYSLESYEAFDNFKYRIHNKALIPDKKQDVK